MFWYPPSLNPQPHLSAGPLQSPVLQADTQPDQPQAEPCQSISEPDQHLRLTFAERQEHRVTPLVTQPFAVCRCGSLFETFDGTDLVCPRDQQEREHAAERAALAERQASEWRRLDHRQMFDATLLWSLLSGERS